MTKIRVAILSDSPAINALSAGLGYKEASQQVAEKRLQCLLDSKNDWVWVYEESNIIQGWIHVFQANRVASSAFFEVGGLVVNPDMRRKGIGRQLVAFAHTACQEKQCELNQCELRVRCHSKREEAHQFYLKAGFTQSKIQHVFTLKLL